LRSIIVPQLNAFTRCDELVTEIAMRYTVQSLLADPFVHTLLFLFILMVR